MNVREATPDDARAVAPLATELGYPMDEALAGERIRARSPGSILLVAEGPHGKALLAAAEAWAREHGLRTLRLRSNVIREGAHAFYTKAGYVIRKTQHAFLKEI